MARGDEGAQARAGLFLATAREVEAALADLDRIAAEAPGAAEDVASRRPTPTRSVLAGGAILHAFYNEIEKVFRTIAGSLNGFEPAGEEWHARLMDQMFLDIPALRPAVLPAELRPALRELRSFRHVFRHLYVFDLDAARVERLLRDLGPLWERMRLALAAFSRTLTALGEALR